MSLPPTEAAPRPLAAPLQLRGRTLRNRMVATAHATAIVRDGVNLPGEGDREYWGRLSAGGAAMAITGATIVAADSQPRVGNLTEAWRPEAVASLRMRAEAIASGGCVPVCQILHLGRETLGADFWDAPIAPAAVRSPHEPTRPRAIGEDEMERLLDGFRATVAHALEAGFAGIELHAAHGYLLEQFLSPSVNTRTDSYGDTAGGIRLLAEIGAIVRAQDPSALLGVRLSARDSLLTLDEVLALIDPLCAALELDYLNVTVGIRGAYVRDMATATPPLRDDVAALRAVTPVPLLVCSAFREAADMEAALRAGADMVGMARALIADPELPRKLLGGHDDDVRPCVACNEDCRAFAPSLLCSVNPELAPAGLALRPANPRLAQGGDGAGSDEAVAVVGAGPAGMECAVALARAGRTVEVFDAHDAVGGALAIASAAPNRSGWARLIAFHRRQAQAHGVTLRLSTPADERTLAPFREIVMATGAKEVAPAIEGIALARTVSEALAAGPDALVGCDHVVVADDGFGWWPVVSAVELALAAGVRRVTVLSPSGSFATGIPAESRYQLMPRLRGHAIDVRGPLTVAAIRSDGVLARNVLSGGEEVIAADAAIVVGERRRRPLEQLPTGARVHAVGDCVVPRRVSHAVAEGRACAELLLSQNERQSTRGETP